MNSGKFTAFIFIFILCFIQCSSDTEAVSQNLNDKNYDIVLDFGHGGADPGVIASDGKTTEKEIVLLIGKGLQAELEKNGFKTLVLRNEDTFISLEKRIELSEHSNPKLLISLHNNASENSEYDGFTTLYQESGAESKKFAEAVESELEKLNLLKASRIQTAPFYILKKSRIPAVRIDIGNLKNPKELSKIKNPENQRKIASAITEAVKRFKKLTSQQI